MIKRADAEQLLRVEWLKRPQSDRTENDVLVFYNEMMERRPDLLSFRASGDKYQHLKSILRDHIVRDKR